MARRRLGRRIGERWTLQRLIGLGGMAAVYAANDERGGAAAVKVLHPAHASSPRQRRRFLREANVVRALRHPGVVRVHASGIGITGEAFLVMELLEGHSLWELSARHAGRLPLARALSLLAQALEALGAAHAAGVIHRDLKPANLFLTRASQLKLLDFGVARACTHLPETPGETCDALVLGTPAFMPPEQARGRWQEVDARSDLWALGATFYTLLSGEYVHGRGTPNELLGRAMVNSAPSIVQVRPELPAALVEFFARALSFERGHRFQSAREMSVALQWLARCSGQSAERARELDSGVIEAWSPARASDEAETLAHERCAHGSRSVAVCCGIGDFDLRAVAEPVG